MNGKTCTTKGTGKIFVNKGNSADKSNRTAGQRARRDGTGNILPMDKFNRKPIITPTVLRWAFSIMMILLVISFFDGRGGW